MTFEEFRHFQETESSIRRGESPSLSSIAPLTLEGLRDMAGAGVSTTNILSVSEKDRERDLEKIIGSVGVSGNEKGSFLSKLFKDSVAASTGHSSGKSLECFSNSPVPPRLKSRVREDIDEVEEDSENGNSVGKGTEKGVEKGTEKGMGKGSGTKKGPKAIPGVKSPDDKIIHEDKVTRWQREQDEVVINNLKLVAAALSADESRLNSEKVNSEKVEEVVVESGQEIHFEGIRLEVEEDDDGDDDSHVGDVEENEVDEEEEEEEEETEEEEEIEEEVEYLQFQNIVEEDDSDNEKGHILRQGKEEKGKESKGKEGKGDGGKSEVSSLKGMTPERVTRGVAQAQAVAKEEGEESEEEGQEEEEGADSLGRAGGDGDKEIGRAHV